MKRALAVVVGLVLAILIGVPQSAVAVEEPPMPTDPKCIYVAEDRSGFEFTFYCSGLVAEKGSFFNLHARNYVNWTDDSPHYVGPAPNGKDGRGQPCPQDDNWGGDWLTGGTRGECLLGHDFSGLGEWMRGQDKSWGKTPPRLLRNLNEDPCVTIRENVEARKRAGIWNEGDPVPNCPDVRKTNPCDKITFKDYRDECNDAHPWFAWQPPAPPANGCSYTEQAQTGDCAGAQLVGTGDYKAPKAVVEPMTRVLGYFVMLVFVAGMFGLLFHVYRGIESYRGGDTVAEVVGSVGWTLGACAIATGVSGVLWTVMTA
ncbi:hypothetical protein [Yinghuangia sp. YIM S10712]|uniref:hypothetical protein n=1 Tax=Yinghuangia sp. YIM S10712 TaxID=3436930 RepID=UPI003F52E3C3